MLAIVKEIKKIKTPTYTNRIPQMLVQTRGYLAISATSLYKYFPTLYDSMWLSISIPAKINSSYNHPNGLTSENITCACEIKNMYEKTQTVA